MNKSAYITIGRYVNGKPMTEWNWKRYQSAILYVAGKHGNVVTAAEGTGQYGGLTEDSFVVVVSNPIAVHALKKALGEKARFWGQDSIAFTLGEVKFLG